MPSGDPTCGATTAGTMEERVKQLEIKLSEQEVFKAGLCNDIKDLKELLNGDRKENQEGFEYHDRKKKKLFGLLDDANKDIAMVQEEQNGLATKAELQALSKQLDDLRMYIDRITPGIHAAASPPSPDLMVFSPGCLINLGEIARSPERLATASNTTTARLLARDRAVQLALELPQPPLLPDLTEKRRHEEEQVELPQKRVKFEAGTKQGDATPSDPGSEDPLAPHATLRRTKSRKRITKTPGPKIASPLDPKSPGKSLRQKASVVLERFKSGNLIDETDDEDETVSQVPASDDTDSTIVVAAKAVATAREAQVTGNVDTTTTASVKAEPRGIKQNAAAKKSGAKKSPEPQQPTAKKPSQAKRSAPKQPALQQPTEKHEVASRRRSGRGPKPKDFGDVEVHGRKKGRAKEL